MCCFQWNLQRGRKSKYRAKISKGELIPQGMAKKDDGVLRRLLRGLDCPVNATTTFTSASSSIVAHTSAGSYTRGIEREYNSAEQMSLRVYQSVNAGRTIHQWQAAVRAGGKRRRRGVGEMVQERRSKQRYVLVILKHNSRVRRSLCRAENGLMCIRNLKVKAHDFLKALQRLKSFRGSDIVLNRLMIICDLNRWRARRTLKVCGDDDVYSNRSQHKNYKNYSPYAMYEPTNKISAQKRQKIQTTNA